MLQVLFGLAQRIHRFGELLGVPAAMGHKRLAVGFVDVLRGSFDGRCGKVRIVFEHAPDVFPQRAQLGNLVFQRQPRRVHASGVVVGQHPCWQHDGLTESLALEILMGDPT